MKHKVVVSQSGVTAGQLKDLFRMMCDGTVDGNNFGGFLKDPHRFTPNQGSVVRALKILGERRVFTPEKMAEVWNPLRKQAGLAPLVIPKSVSIPSEDVLREVRGKGGDWVLAYSDGLSLREQRQTVGIKAGHQPCFNASYSLWLEKKENVWAIKGVQPGYYLVDLQGRFGLQTWQGQEESIQKKLGSVYERTDEHLISEIILSACLINGERLLENFFHWGTLASGSYDYRVVVGLFDLYGLRVDGYHLDTSNYTNLRACVSRKFQK